MVKKVRIDEGVAHAHSRSKVDLSSVDFSTLLTKKSEVKADVFDKVIVQDIFPPREGKASSLLELMDLSYDALKRGEFDKASELLQKAAFVDLESSLPSAILKCSDFWAEKKRRYVFMDLEKRSDFLVESWDIFIEAIVAWLSIDIDRPLFHIRMWVFGHVADDIEQQLLKKENELLYLKLGRAYKKRGDYDKAIDAYAYGLNLQKDNVLLLSELADCYAITDEENSARILFKEAFYYAPDKIDFNYLESAMILNLKQKVEELPYEKPYLQYWIAVYGVVYGVFHLSRELRPTEYTRLNQSIHILRSDLDEKGDRKGELRPQLINKLFWLIDYHRALVADPKLASEVIKRSLLEIRFLDERIYKQYKI